MSRDCHDNFTSQISLTRNQDYKMKLFFFFNTTFFIVICLSLVPYTPFVECISAGTGCENIFIPSVFPWTTDHIIYGNERSPDWSAVGFDATNIIGIFCSYSSKSFLDKF